MKGSANISTRLNQVLFIKSIRIVNKAEWYFRNEKKNTH